MRMRPRDISINLGLLLITIILFFGGIEATLRLTGLVTVKPNPPKIFQQSAISDISYELKPNIAEHAYRSTVTTNSLGFRSAEVDPAKPIVAFLGDSITFGYGLEDAETITSRIQSELPGWNILNTGAPGYNLIQQTAVYREKVKKLDPKAIVLIFHFNDVEEVGLELAHLDDQGILRPQGWEPSEELCAPPETGILALVPGKCWLDLHSALYKGIKKYVNARQGSRDLEQQEQEAKANAFTENIADTNLEQYGIYLAKLRAELPEGLPRLFVIWPERHLHFIARPKLRSLAEANGFHVLDLYEVFGNEAETLSWDTVHPSSRSAEKGAQVIKAALEHYGFFD